MAFVITKTEMRYQLSVRDLIDPGSRTTEIYTHVSKKAINKIKNPVDEFFE